MFPLGTIGKERGWKGNIHGCLGCQGEYDSPRRDWLSESLSPFLKGDYFSCVDQTAEEETRDLASFYSGKKIVDDPLISGPQTKGTGFLHILL